MLNQIDSGTIIYGVCLNGSSPRCRKQIRWMPRRRSRLEKSLSCFVFEPTTTLMTERLRRRSARSSASRIVNSTPSASIAERMFDESACWAFAALPLCCCSPAFVGAWTRTGGGVPFVLPLPDSPIEPLSEATSSDIATNAVCLGTLIANGNVPWANSSAGRISSTITRLLLGSNDRWSVWIASSALLLLLLSAPPPKSPSGWVILMPSRSRRSSALIRRHFSDLSSSSGISVMPYGESRERLGQARAWNKIAFSIKASQHIHQHKYSLGFCQRNL